MNPLQVKKKKAEGGREGGRERGAVLLDLLIYTDEAGARLRARASVCDIITHG